VRSDVVEYRGDGDGCCCPVSGATVRTSGIAIPGRRDCHYRALSKYSVNRGVVAGAVRKDAGSAKSVQLFQER
jgi:hypothetical protein